MRIIAFDTETYLIVSGLLAPPMVCLTYAELGQTTCIVHARDAKPLIAGWLGDYDIRLVGHNLAYDMGVIAAMWPDLLPAIFAKYDRDECTDTLVREQLIQIARGTFRFYMSGDEIKPVKYSLLDLAARHLGISLNKGADTWRLRYAELEHLPVEEWPADARQYALDDASTTLAVYESQARVAPPEVLFDQYRQARAAFALHLSSCWGMHTDPESVEALEVGLREEFNELQAELCQAGIIRPDGTANVAAARDAMVAACDEAGVTVARTPKGAVSLGADACERFDEDTTIGQYSRYLTLRKTLTNDIEMLKKGCEVPIQPRYNMADTGRTTCRAPNVQALNKGAGIREAFRAREGMTFIQGDYEALELHTLAQWCQTVLGQSELAKVLNAKQDVHAATGAQMMGISYADMLALKKTDLARYKDARQKAKAVNFGFPGGLGAPKLVKYARMNYGVIMTEAEAVAARQAWMARFPEMTDHFRSASAATNGPEKLGTETHIFSNRVRGNVRYSALCNGRFQGLGADAAKNGLWLVTRACYAEPTSALYGCRVCAFVHDEIICEAPIDRAAEAAILLGKLMVEGANAFLPDVPARVEPMIMGERWTKKAEPTYGPDGRLIPWTPKT